MFYGEEGFRMQAVWPRSERHQFRHTEQIGELNKDPQERKYELNNCQCRTEFYPRDVEFVEQLVIGMGKNQARRNENVFKLRSKQRAMFKSGKHTMFQDSIFNKITTVSKM